MKIDYLGHSEFIVEMEGDQGPVRILADAWLSSHAFGDFLSRNPVLPPSAAELLPPLDGVFLTHPHCDHFDPYTLVPLYRRQRPTLLLPETALYMKPLLDEYLGNPDILVLCQNEAVPFRGLELTGINYVNGYHSNEDDVMCLAIKGKNSWAFLEGDTAVPDTEEAWEEIYRMAADQKFADRLYVAVRNELEALFLSYDGVDVAERRRALQAYRSRREDEIVHDYEKFAESDVPEIWALPGVTRVLIGQGMILPPELDADFLKLSSPFPLPEVVGLERRAAARFKKKMNILAHRPGWQVELGGGRVAGERRLDGMSAQAGFREYSVSFDPDVLLRRKRLFRPLRNVERDRSRQRALFLDLLNRRYLPALACDLEEPLKKVLTGAPGRTYAIEIRYGTATEHKSEVYGIGFGDFAFREILPDEIAEKGIVASESYWANDLEDHLDGSQDMFSTTLHTFEEGRSIRLWNWLGLPFLNSDLVYRKMALHFERAAKGETVADWVLPVVRENLARES